MIAHDDQCHSGDSDTSQSKQFTQHVTESMGDFRIIREIGRGGMGIVYEAEQKSLKRQVALKVIGTRVAGSPKQLQRFQREAEAAAFLHHTNIVSVYGIGEHDGRHFYAMQFIDGVPLSDVIQSAKRIDSVTKILEQSVTDGRQDGRSGGDELFTAIQALQSRDAFGPDTQSRLSESDVAAVDKASDNNGTSLPKVQLAQAGGDGAIIRLGVSFGAPRLRTRQNKLGRTYFNCIARIAAETAAALNYAHRQGVLHRDIKPSNLMLNRDGVVWITDFGLAKHEDHDDVTNTGDIVGTLRYMAPEQFDGQTDARSDVYGLGLTLYELLTLRPAFDELRHGPLIQQKTTRKLLSPRTVNPAIPRDLDTITQKACAFDPIERYQTAGELAKDLQRFLEDRPIAARRVNVLERLWRWVRRNPTTASLSGATFILLLAVAFAFGVGNYHTGRALARVDEQRRNAVFSARKARDEHARAETNLNLAVQAFQQIIDNLATRGVPQSLAMDFDDEKVPVAETVVTSADAKLLETLLVFFDEFATANQADFTDESADARKRVGDLQQRLGRLQAAETNYRQAFDAYALLSQREPQRIVYIVAKARILNEIAVVASRRGEVRSALEMHEQARRLLDESLETMQTTDGRFELARTLYLMGSIGLRSGFLELLLGVRSVDSSRRGSGEIRGRSRSTNRERDHANPEQSRQRGKSRQVSRARNRWLGDLEAATGRSLDLLADLVDADMSNPDYRLALARTHRSRVRLVRRDEGDESPLQMAIDLLDQLVLDFPGSPVYQYELADTLCINSPLASSVDSDRKYLDRVRRAVLIGEELVTTYPNIPEYQALSASALAKLGRVQHGEGQHDAARQSYLRALVFQQPLAERFHDVSLYQIVYAQSLHGLADVETDQVHPEQALQYLDTAISYLKTYVLTHRRSQLLHWYIDRLSTRRRELAPGLPDSGRKQTPA